MKQSFWLAVLLLLGGCIKVQPFVPLVNKTDSQPLPTSALLSSEDQQELTQLITNETYFDAAVILRNDSVLYTFGEINTPFNAASVRKSIFSALYGIAAGKGLLHPDSSLASLGIDDATNPLRPTEIQATLAQLLSARSGIYLPSLGESAGMVRRKPARGAYLPGEHFYYNNWDFNALPIILQKITNQPVEQLIDVWLAQPLGFTNYTAEHVTYQYDSKVSEYPQTRLYISAMDLARFGALYATQGHWRGQQIIDSAWVALSTSKISKEPNDRDLVEHPFMEGYGYLWWVDDETGTFWADGAGGHFVIVHPAKKLTVVLRNNTGMSGLGVLLYSATNNFEGNEGGDKVYKALLNLLEK